MANEKYQGYSNYPTWAVMLRINNTQEDYCFWHATAKEYQETSLELACKSLLADCLKNKFEEEMIAESEKMANYIWRDILNFGFNQIGWEEIAKTLLQDIQEDIS